MSKVAAIINSFFRGQYVGKDNDGNKYYRTRRSKLPKEARNNKNLAAKYEKRWVIYKNKAEPSVIPPLWHSWMHFLSNDIPASDSTSRAGYDWQKSHHGNLTGTTDAYLPNSIKYGHRSKSSSDYEAWNP